MYEFFVDSEANKFRELTFLQVYPYVYIYVSNFSNLSYV